MEDPVENKEDVNKDTVFDAFTDGTSVHRKYKLRGAKPKRSISESPEKNSVKKPIFKKTGRDFSCDKCTKLFDSKTGLLNHLRMHDVIKKFTCALCDKVFDTNDELIKHKTVHKGEDRVFLCKICKVAFTDHCDFLVHDIDHMKRKMYKCMECAVYYEPHYIKRHIETHFDRSTECKICGKTYQNALRMKYHMKTHDSSNQLQCGECGRIFKDKAFLNYHMISHTGVKPFQCLYCGQGFANSQQRTVHTKRIHTTDRPHQCDVCNNKFKTKGDLKGHMITHDKEKNVKCEECGKKFYHRTSLLFHLKSHTNVNMFECPDCGKKCPSRQSLRTHMIYIHMDAKNYKCEVCDVSFKTPKDITRHNNTKTHKRAEYGMKMKKEEL